MRTPSPNGSTSSSRSSPSPTAATSWPPCATPVAWVSSERSASPSSSSRPSSTGSTSTSTGTYGVDIVIPGKYEGMDEIDPDKLEDMLKAHDPRRGAGVRPGHLRRGRRPRPRPTRRSRTSCSGFGHGHRDAPARGGAGPPQVFAHRQRARHATRRGGRPRAGGRPAHRRPVRLGQARPRPQGGRAGLHRVPGRRGRRPHRRRRFDRAVARGHRGGRRHRRCWRPVASGRASRWLRPW